MWQSFHFDENTERLDSFVTFIVQVATTSRLWGATNVPTLQAPQASQQPTQQA